MNYGKYGPSHVAGVREVRVTSASQGPVVNTGLRLETASS